MAWEVGGNGELQQTFRIFWEVNLDKTAEWCLENEKDGGKLCKWVMIIWLVTFSFSRGISSEFLFVARSADFRKDDVRDTDFFQVCKFAVNPYGFVSWFFAAWKIMQSLTVSHGKAPWLASRMHAAVGAQRLLVRVSMCLLHSFSQVFGEQVQYVLFASHVKMMDERWWKWKYTTDIEKYIERSKGSWVLELP